jgi:hypothetical protein
MLLMVKVLLGLRAEIVQRRVTPASIIVPFDVVEQIRSGLVAGMIDMIVHQFTFQTAEEAFHERIVVRAPNTVHACLGTMFLQQRLTGSIRILAALIGVVDEPGT